jgi:sulfate adenylyltransferase subunit 1
VWLKHQSRRVAAQIVGIARKLDVATGTSAPADALKLNDLGALELVLGDPIVATSYAVDRALGSALLVDPTEGDTLAAAMVVDG